MTGVIETHSGLMVDVFDPRPEVIEIGDIAYSLSNIARFNGHAKRFYSVAEHCVRGSCEISGSNALWFLMHDAAEAYVGDTVRPLKTKAHREVEERVLRVIAEKYGLRWPMPGEVKEVDDRMLATEARDLMASGGVGWPPVARTTAEPYGSILLVDRMPEEWELNYLQIFHALTGGRWE